MPALKIGTLKQIRDLVVRGEIESVLQIPENIAGMNGAI